MGVDPLLKLMGDASMAALLAGRCDFTRPPRRVGGRALPRLSQRGRHALGSMAIGVGRAVMPGSCSGGWAVLKCSAVEGGEWREIARHVGQVHGHVDEVLPARAGGFGAPRAHRWRTPGGIAPRCRRRGERPSASCGCREWSCRADRAAPRRRGKSRLPRARCAGGADRGRCQGGAYGVVHGVAPPGFGDGDLLRGDGLVVGVAYGEPVASGGAGTARCASPPRGCVRARAGPGADQADRTRCGRPGTAASLSADSAPIMRRAARRGTGSPATA